MMLKELWEDRIRQFQPENALEQELVLQEIMQQHILLSLSRSGFFKQALFHGGTCLRIFYRLPRFSEDLDFLLRRSDPSFAWSSHIAHIQRDCEADGIQFEAVDKSRAEVAVKKAFLKTDSIGTLIVLNLPYARHAVKKLRIKLEIDANPPAGSAFETQFITFPGPAAITTQDLPSGFATKAHALLCRGYAKGRDWYDFLWYIDRRVSPNFPLLQNALAQVGPWAGQPLQVAPAWFVERMRERILELDWNALREDVRRFLPLRDQEGLNQWSAGLFLYLVDQMAEYLVDPKR
jgi:predicted nucleotidyltransferase component of viral defense system